MFKIIGRILVILLFATLVAGGLYVLVQNGSASSTAFAPERQLEGRTFDRNPEGGSFALPADFREHESEGEFSIGRGLGGMLVTLLKIGVIAVIVLLAQKALSKTPRLI